MVETFKDNCYDHGRMESRKCYVIQDNSCITDKIFESIKTIAKVHRKRELNLYDSKGQIIKTKKEIQEVYYVSDRKLGAEEFAVLVRDHWKVEDSLHWVLDNTFREDRSTARKGHATVSNISWMN